MADFDAGYKRLFSHRQMVADLLVGFVNEPWVNEVDLETLERVSGSYVSDDFRERESDIVWRVRWRQSWLYVYLLVEFQSTVDPFMALRMMVYVGMLYQDLIRAKLLSSARLLPPVLPIVLYNGDRSWTSARNVSELVDVPPSGLECYRPQMRYLLLEERQYDETDLTGMQNVVAALFRLENSRGPEDVCQVIEALGAWLQRSEQSELRRAFVGWLREVLLPRRMPEAKSRIPELENLQEVRTLLAERVQEWTKQWREEGRKEGRKEGVQEGIEKGIEQGIEQGRAEGIAEGRKEGQARLLIRLLERKFGLLDAEVHRRISEADADRLLVWGEQLMTADHLEDVFR